MASGHDAGGSSWPLVAGLSTPAVVADEDGRLVFLNAKAEAFWDVRLADIRGQRAAAVLRLLPPEGRGLDAWLQHIVAPALESGTPLPGRVAGSDGHVHLVELTGMWETRAGHRYVVLLVREEAGSHLPRNRRSLVLRDPATGLISLNSRAPVYLEWDARGGIVALFDVDGLREINALYGWATGDRALALAGQALAAEAPLGALAARYGMDEFVLLAEAGPFQADEIAGRIRSRIEVEARAADVRVAPRLHHGVAPFAPGGLASALRQAGDALYQSRGVLLPAASGGRLVLTREGRAALQKPIGSGPPAAPGAFASNFSPEFDRYFRQAYARSVEQAREFVAFAAPTPGSAVVEVGAGSGRISFDGGLAERVGPGGQLLLTDPSPAQLAVAQRRAEELGLGWVRFLAAPVEALPLAPGTADLCLGSTFLHFTEPREALRAMARAVRAGGRVALSAVLQMEWSPDLLDVLAPVWRLLSAHGLPMDFGTPRPELEQAFEAAGLTIDRAVEASEESRLQGPELAVASRQVRFVELLLRRVPGADARALQEEFEARARAVGARIAPAPFTFTGRTINVVAHR